MHSSNGPVERAIQTMTNLVLANKGDGNNLTESVNRALTVMRFTIHTGLKKTPIELHHGWKPRTEQTKFIKFSIRLIGTVHFSTQQTDDTDIRRSGRRRRNHQTYGDSLNNERREATSFESKIAGENSGWRSVRPC